MSNGVKIILISYNVAIDEEVMEALKKMGISGYTKLPKVLGDGKTSGPRLDSHIWPGANSLLFLAVDDDKKDQILAQVRKMRQRLGKEGIKAFVLPLEEIT